MQILKLKVSTTDSIEMLCHIVKIYCVMAKLDISKTETKILAYLIKYGTRKSTKELIVRSQILGSRGSLENAMTRLRGLGLIVKDREGLPMVNKKLSFQPDTKLGIIIQLENV